MHTTASSLVAIAQYFWRIRTSVLYGNQQKFNIEAANDYPPFRFKIHFEQKFAIRRSLLLGLIVCLLNVQPTVKLMSAVCMAVCVSVSVCKGVCVCVCVCRKTCKSLAVIC